MVILGINAYHADSSACIFVNGKMIAAIEEERFTRVKHWAGFPKLAIEFCLKEAGVTLAQVDHICIGRDPNAKFFRKILYLLKNPNGSLKAITERLSNSKKINSLADEFIVMDAKIDTDLLRKKIRHIEHHRAHLASAFFASPFKESALLSIDGSGDFSTTMIGVGRGNQIEVLDSIDFPHSMGLFYTAFTQLLGFPHYGDEYKVMGLAPYGEAKYVEQLKEVINFLPNGLFSLNLKYFKKGTKGIVTYGDDHIPNVATLYTDALVQKFGNVRGPGEELLQYHKDLAASIQRVTEQVIFHILTHLHTIVKSDNICIAGGVAQNSVANGKITRNTPFKNVYIPSAGHDAGIAMGAGLYEYNHNRKQDRQPVIYNAYTGSHFSNDEIETYLMTRDVQYIRYEDNELYEKVAEKLVNGGVIGWFTGRAEFGPRALGGRSILADPRRADAKELLNSKVKRRESFRPFAPSILQEYVREYFEIDDMVPFMEKVFPIKPEKYAIIPAVTHVDGTGRLQSVIKDICPRYYRLIETFYQKTGVPILLNTSFNENEPIVNSPQEALDCYLRTSMDMLVLENCIISR